MVSTIDSEAFISDFQRNFEQMSRSTTSFGGNQIVLQGAVNRWSEFLSIELDKLSRLRVGWDGYGSRAPSRPFTDNVMRFLSSLAEVRLGNQPKNLCELADAPFLLPVPGGGVQAEWHVKGVFIELCFNLNGQIEASYYSETDENIDQDRLLVPDTDGYEGADIASWLASEYSKVYQYDSTATRY